MAIPNATKAISWFDYLHYNVHMRLSQRQTTKGYLSILLDAKWQWAHDAGRYNGYTKDGILVDILDLLDCNVLDSVMELAMKERRNLTK